MKPAMRCTVVVLLALTGACQPERTVDPADIVFVNGGIYTVDRERSWAEAAAVRDGIIVAVGTNEGIEEYKGGATRIIDLKGRMAVPGFHDSHAHPLEGGYLMRYCDLSELGTNIDAIIRIIRDCVAASDDEWIIGFGLDLSLFGPNGPDKRLLDDIAPDRLFLIDAEDGHSALVNSRTLELAGIDRDTPDPVHGVIERRPVTGEPSGTLRESARDIVDALRPARELDESVAAMGDAIRSMNAMGITSVIDAWAGELELKAYRELELAGSLTMRVRNSIVDEGVFGKHFGPDFERVLAARHELASDLIDNDSVKIYVDGVFEGETASVIEPYHELGHRGTLNHSPDELKERVARYDSMGLQVHMHTMGDGGARAALDAIEYARGQNADASESRDLRHHLAHLGLIHADDIARFGQLNVAANFTAAWAYPTDWDLKLNLPTLGRERIDAMYPIDSVHSAGGVVVGGSDWIYGPLDPLISIEVAITRQDPNDPDGLIGNTDDSVDISTMIDAYTINGAWLMHQEDRTGSIDIGKRADIVVLDRSLFAIPATEISEASVDLTIFDGTVVYER